AGKCRLQNKITKSLLGGLKIDRTGSIVKLRGLKDYSFGAKNVIKGIRVSALKITDNVYSQEKWPSFRGLLRSGKPEDYIVETVTKHLTRNYTKGNVNLDGVVSPYVFADSAVIP
ncbi:unnamed protein product, partial [marine sediment metagenome]